MTFGSGRDNCFGQVALCVGSGLKRLPDGSQRRGIFDIGWLGVVILEAGGELVSLVNDLLGGSGHRHHLKYFGRAGMAWTMTGPSSDSTTPTS